jgi:predicted membrane protein
MKERKNWWSISLLKYSSYVRSYYFLTLFLMIFGSSVIFRAYFMLPDIDWKLFLSIIIIFAFIYTLTRCIKKMKKEYEEKELGY